MNIKYTIPLIILLIVLGAGIFYWQKNKNNPEKISKNNNSGSVAGINIESSETNDIGIGSNNNASSNKISDGNTYQSKIGEIRKPINDTLYDLTDRLKYQKKYNKDDIVSAAKIAREQTEEGKKEIENLNIDAKFNYANQKHIQSVQYLIEAIDAVDQLLKTGEAKYSDEFNLKIDYSNREINNLSIPK